MNSVRVGKIVFYFCLIFLFFVDQYIDFFGASWKTFSKANAQNRISSLQELINSGGKQAQAPFFYIYREKPDKPFVFFELDAMLLSQDIKRPTLNGYSSRRAPAYDIFNSCQAAQHVVAVINESGQKELVKKLQIVDGIGNCDINKNISISKINKNLEDSCLRYNINVENDPIGNQSGKAADMQVKLTNTSKCVWPALGAEGGKYSINLTWRVLNPTGHPITGFVTRASLPYDLEPNMVARFDIDIDRPEIPNWNSFMVEFSVVQEHAFWFHDKGVPTFKIPFLPPQ